MRWLFAPVLFGALLAAPLPALGEVVEAEDDVFVTRDAAVVSAEPYDAWRMLIAVAEWWNPAHSWSGDSANLYLSAQANGCFCELMPPADGAPEDVRRGSVRHMVVEQVDPPRVLRMRGGLGPLQSEPVEGVLTITLEPVDAGTRIVWEYVVGGAMRYEQAEMAEAVDTVMSAQLRGLAAKLGRADTPREETEAAPEDDDASLEAAIDALDADEEGG